MNTVTSKCVLLVVLVVCASMFAPGTVHAQTNSDLNAALALSMKGIGKRYQDSVVLRWAPANAALWRIARVQGYRVERAEVQRGTVGPFAVLTPQPVLQWTDQQWTVFLQNTPITDTTEEQLIAVAQSLCEPLDPAAETPVQDLADLQAIRDSKSRLETSYSFALLVAERSRIAANALAMRYVDRTAVVGTSYMYRISVLGATSPYVVAPAMIAVSPSVNLAAMNAELTAVGLDTKVVLAWTNSTGHSTFDVYRSLDGKNYTKLNDAPILTLRHGTADSEANGFLDSNLTNYIVYTYRIVGHNAFAEMDELGTATAMPRDLTAPPTPTGVRTEHVGHKDVDITWEMVADPTPDLAGFYVQRARSEEGPFTVLHAHPLPGSARQFRDTTAVLGDTLYYQVVAVDTAKNGSVSFAVYVAFADSMPPSAATLVSGIMDTAGVVRIVVRHPEARDVMGYRLLIANDAAHEFSVKRELFHEDSVFVRTDTIIVDTAEVRTLTKHVYYSVVALDYHFNESDMSNILAVPRPDVIPPVAPVVHDYNVTDTTVVLYYHPSSSRDVSRHVIQRRTYTEGRMQDVPWDSLAAGGIYDSVIIDKSGAIAATYQYAVVALDSAGNTSPLSNVVTLVRYDNGIRPAVELLQAVYDSTTKSTRLSWVYNDIGEVHRFIIYRQTGSNVESYAIVKDQRLREFVDAKSASPGVTYAIKVVCDGGAESTLSEKATAR